MKIFVNEEEKKVEENITISQLLEILKLNKVGGIAIAINEEVINRTQWTEKIINANDKVLIVKATQGG